jgi:hypothetical protein
LVSLRDLILIKGKVWRNQLKRSGYVIGAVVDLNGKLII